MIPERYRKYKKTVTVTCVNFHTTWGDKAANLAKMKANIEEAVAVGSKIIAFPEMGLSGY
ncbi:MAG: nitrilase-related carbon-nitrogen hydrolase, partial [Dehalococcoidia bacterium]|nr:nitrilase-related carbon-nitrogen hydrolase [Dehalococcoidia bacterium]